MRIHVLQHVSFEGPGCIARWAAARGHVLTTSLRSFPAVHDFDALVIMGGPMGAYEDDQYHWMPAEKALIRETIASGKKVLGICLGAQLIASVLGAAVKAAPQREIGWYPVQPTAAANRHLWLEAVFADAPVVFHWHGDQFAIPAGAEDLLTSAANVHQAFLVNDQVLGLQFHLEVMEADMEAMLEHGAEDLAPGAYVQNAAQIRAGSPHLARANARMVQLLDGFFGGMVARLRAGDWDAHQQVIERYHRLLFHFVSRMIPDPRVVEDIVVGTFSKLWEYRSRVTDLATLRTLLFTTSRNDSLVQMHNDKDLLRRFGKSPEAVPDGDEWVEQVIARADVYAEILKAVDALPGEMPQLFVEGFLDKIPEAEMAEARKVSTGAMTQQKADSLALLMERVKEQGAVAIKILQDWLAEHQD
ncbi:glutamine amidotransferase-related protein [Chitinophaga parva]|uniref:glutamine amidotransferase-related protein n=1 Tax=Chitinophaga parva TaxID=2169414 RepID=UPI001403BA78|nr:hypothetical protein [Chitinophaga parva]